MKRDKGFLEYLLIFYRRRKYILIVFFSVCFISIAVSFVLPKWYRSSTTIMPPVPEKRSLGISSVLSNFSMEGLGLSFGGTEEKDIFIAILKSRTVMEAAVKEFDLIKRYRSRNIEEAIKSLRKNVSVVVDDEGTITLSVQARAPALGSRTSIDGARELAREMAEFFIKKLDEVNSRLRSERARNTRIFIEKRYYKNLEDLRKAEEALTAFQEKHGIVALPEQTTASLSAAAELKARIIVKEVELGSLERYFGQSHSDVIRARSELAELKKRYKELIGGKEDYDLTSKGDNTKLFLSFKEAPGLAMEYLRLFREVVLQEKILEFILPQYEEAKIREVRDTPTVQVLDRANLPIKKCRPKRVLIVVFFSFMSLVFCFLYIYVEPGIRQIFKTLNRKE